VTGALLIAWLATTGAENGTPAETEAIEEIEEIVDLDTLDEPEYVPPPPTLTQTISRMHAALVHLPIGFLLAAMFLELLATLRHREELRRAAWLVLAGTLLAFLPATATGLLQLYGMGDDAPRLDPTSVHRNLMLIALALVVAATIAGHAPAGRARLWTYRALLLLATAVVTVGGHLGGKLVFGPHYLPF